MTLCTLAISLTFICGALWTPTVMADNPDADIAAYMSEADTDHDGSIDFQEFLSLWYKNVSAKAVQEFKKF